MSLSVRATASAVAATTTLALVLVLPVGADALDDAAFGLDTACPPDAVPTHFHDVGPPHGRAADCLAWYGIAEGTAPGIFDTGSHVTRAQTTSLLFRLLRQLEEVTLPERRHGAFPDVGSGPHHEAIETLTAFEPPVVRGFTDGTFRPQASTTRGQMASVVVRTLDEVAAQIDGLRPLPPATSPYEDTAGSVHEQAIGRLSAAGVVVGFGDGTFRPGSTVTRGQVATMLARSMGALVDAGLLTLPSGDPGTDPDLDVALTLTEVAAMDAPTAGAVGPDGRLYLAERAGTVHALGPQGVDPAVVDVSAETTTGGERGLLGLAFAPDGGELYLSFTDLAGDSVVEAFAVDDGTIRPGQRRTVLHVEQPDEFTNHNGGDLQFSPDGMLYLGLGDGGGSGDPLGNGQDTSTLLGGLVRIDPRGATPYAVPTGNPFVGDPDGADELFAYGLRNPWRFSFDRRTGDLWIADVGQSQREEINWMPAGQGAGANYGWNLMEGTLEFAGSEPDDHVPPIYEYATRGPEGCAITGGYVYRGQAIPELRGAYLYADYCEGLVRGLVHDRGEVTEQSGLGISGSRVVSFAQDALGELYLLDFAGSVHRIDPA